MANATLTMQVGGSPVVAVLGADVVWTNEHEWSGVKQSVRHAVDGTAIVEWIYPMQGARPVRLECGWLGAAVVAQIVAMRDDPGQATMTLALCDGLTMQVRWAHQDGPPVQTVPTVPRPDYTSVPQPDWSIVALELFEAA